MKKSLTCIALVLGVGLGIARVADDAKYPPYEKAKTLYAKNDFRGKAAPKFVVEKWLQNEPKSMKGKVILVDFWATWCPPCRELIPEMNAWHKKFGKDLIVIGVSDEKAATVSDFMKTSKGKMDYHVAIDTSAKMKNILGVEGIPHCMVISADGIVRWQGFPLDDKDPLTSEKLQQIIAASKAKVK